MTHHYLILEPPKDPAGEGRADFFRNAFGGMWVPALDDSCSIMIPPGKVHKAPFYRAAVFSSPVLAARFMDACVMRENGEDILQMVRDLGFYPVNVDGITLVSADKELFPPHVHRPPKPDNSP